MPNTEGLHGYALYLADKIEAFVCSQKVRYRDLWDLAWLSRTSQIDLSKALRFRILKAQDYGEVETYRQQFPLVEKKIVTAMASPAFATEMARFLPPSRIARTISRPLWMQANLESLTALFASAAPEPS